MTQPQAIEHRYSAAAQHSAVIQYIPLNEKLAAFKHTHSVDYPPDFPRQLQASPEQSVSQGIGLVSDIDQFILGRLNRIPPAEKLWVVPAETRMLMQKVGFSRGLDSLYSMRATDDSTYDDFAQGKFTLQDVCKVDVYWHNLFDHTGRALPLAIKFDYINGHFSNKHFDLAGALKHLSSHPRILGDKGRGETPVDGVPLEIYPIPHYNATDEQQEYLSFRFCPTQEDAERIQEAVNKPNYGSMDQVNAIFKLDMLGLKKAGLIRENIYE
ncbi:hypothetical protein LC612_37020 [Nostoc sp. CHAB 5834]|nr:hypothetical protein [Nostoc sp. CHAB 5834]